MTETKQPNNILLNISLGLVVFFGGIYVNNVDNTSKVNANNQARDHDMLIEIRVNQKQLQETVKKLEREIDRLNRND